jgi:predicted dehydrogenase
MLKVAIAGCGLIAMKSHIPAFMSLKNKAKIVALCDLNEDALKKTAGKFNIKKSYKSFSELLLQEKPDIVDICTPPQTHADLAVQAIQNGAHVLLEKPMALKTSDCDCMIGAASRHKKKICVMHNQIFNPVFIQAKEMVLKGEIGEFLGINIFISTPFDYMTSKKEHWIHRLPGGMLGETGPHGVYLALAFLKDVNNVDVHAKKVMHEYPWSSFEDFRILLSAKNGIGSVTLNYCSNQWAANVDIIGSKGILKIDLENQSLVRYDRPNLNALYLGLSTAQTAFATLKTTVVNGIKYISGKRGSTHYIGIHKFIESILEDKTPAISGQEARETVRLMEAIIERLKCAA